MSDEQRRFIRVPIGTIKSCVDRLGVKSSEEVYSGLAEDVSFRIRQIAENACQFMHHSKRRCLTVEDMDRAMKYSGLEPVLGYHSELPCQYGNLVLEHVTSAADLASDDDTLPDPVPMVTASWQAVEGVKLGEEEVLQGAVELSTAESQTHQEYLSLILQAVTGEDEDQRKIALIAVQTKHAVASILPGLTQYLQQTLANWEQFTPAQLHKVLKLVLAVFTNGGLYLGPYSTLLFPLLRGILVAPGFLSCEGRVHHWHVRSMAAAAMAQLLERCSASLSHSRQELFALFQQQFSHAPQSSIPVLYGAVLVLCGLGYASIMEVLLPHLATMVGFCNSVESTRKDDISKLLEAILVAAKVLLTSEERTPLLPTTKSSLAERQHHGASKRGGVVPPQLCNGTVNGGSAGGDPVPAFGGGVLDFAAGSGSSEMMETAPPSSTTTDPPPSDPASLYNYLEELMGEGLTLSLSIPAHHGETSSSQSPTPKPNPSKTLPDIPKSSSATSKRVNHSLENFLSREGFRPIRVQLPQRAPPPPSVPRGYYKGREPWTFSVPQAVLPVPGNPLKQQQQRRQKGERSSQNVRTITAHLSSSVPGVGALKGTCASLRRRHHRDSDCPIDMAASWI